jgi:hypothetical protein
VLLAGDNMKLIVQHKSKLVHRQTARNRRKTREEREREEQETLWLTQDGTLCCELAAGWQVWVPFSSDTKTRAVRGRRKKKKNDEWRFTKEEEKRKTPWPHLRLKNKQTTRFHVAVHIGEQT